MCISSCVWVLLCSVTVLCVTVAVNKCVRLALLHACVCMVKWKLDDGLDQGRRTVAGSGSRVIGEDFARPKGPQPYAGRAEGQMGFLVTANQPPPHQLGGLGSAVISSSGHLIVCWILHREPKSTKMFCHIFHKTQSNKSWSTLSWIILRYSSLNVFQLTWIVSLHYLVILSIRVL